jgi:thiol-disulfide isomerase/thioredoxin
MNAKLRNLLLAIVVALVSASVGLYLAGRKSELLEAAPDAAARLLALELPDLADQPQSLAQWRGQVLVVNFWATWCPPCRKEIPEFVAISEKLQGKGVQFVGISIDSADKVRQFRDEARISYPLLIGGMETMDFADHFGSKVKGLPFTVILDRQGQLHHVKLGPMSGQELEEILESALAKTPAG